MERFFVCNIPKKNIITLITALPHDDKVMARKTIARKNKVKPEDIKKLYMAAHDFFYATMITYNAIGTKQEASVAKYQGVRLAKAKKVLDLL
jgi:hypothetical protein